MADEPAGARGDKLRLVPLSHRHPPVAAEVQAGPDRQRDPAGEQRSPYRREDHAVHSQAAATQDDSDHEDPDRAHSGQPCPPPAPNALLAGGRGHEPVDPEDEPGITNGERERVHATSPASPPEAAERTSITVCRFHRTRSTGAGRSGKTAVAG